LINSSHVKRVSREARKRGVKREMGILECGSRRMGRWKPAAVVSHMYMHVLNHTYPLH
jgi:hypothetical protein